MGGENSKQGRADGRSSLGEFDNKLSFGEAFNKAHSAGGPGHTFTHRGKLFNTNCADGGNYRKELDSRDEYRHDLQAYMDIRKMLSLKKRLEFMFKNIYWVEDILGLPMLTDRDRDITRFKHKSKEMADDLYNENHHINKLLEFCKV